MKNRSSYLQLIPFILPQSTTITLAFICTLLFTTLWPIQAWLAGEMTEYIGRGDTNSIARLAGLTAVVFIVKGIVQYGQDSLMAKAALTIALNLRKVVYSHLQKLSLNYFEVAKTGDLTYRLTEDIDRIGEVVNQFFHDFVPCILQLIVVLGYMLWLNWQLTMATLVLAPLMAIIIGAFGERLLQYFRRSQNRISNLSALLTEVLGGIRLVQAFAAEDYELSRFAQEAEGNCQAKYQAEKAKAFQIVVVGFLTLMSVVAIFFLGGWQISQNNLTGKEFVSYLAGVALLIDPITHTTNNYNSFKEGQASADKIFELLAIEPSVTEPKNAIALQVVTGKVEYNSVSFAYVPQTPVINNLSLTASPGETIALVGSSGAGKSTLVNLLPRFYNVDQGDILIDGVNIKNVTLKSLRQQIGIVPQETTLFSGTIAQNIAFGKTDLDLQGIEKAAKIANAHQFISELSQGYFTYVGERGVNLSGGQRQRITIARAILLNPPILILDEATSALDSESEDLVQEALERIMQERTVFVIAHRLATVRRADRILVLEKGQIVESGNHQELLNKHGIYASFYARQFQAN
ncbi:ABC transporter ATP-binding protein [Waterburya agarophytonicola K14]|uniref:ABC transporter ATP-binding protein n=1 Tax=Waterburya agarophytonicola KI4 TaxID=2874699 RepID=A0A964FFU0_9CYAN|nr:ABC transporter ATP-binding protein [Waterburya agarophytonicola]MCC0178180.1 ABC transporter ATP-binding protein [Waterburya agarophytonicola KI4]